MPRAEVTSLKKHLRESPDLQKLRHKRKMVRVRFFVVLCILVITLCCGFVVLARSPKLQITTIKVTGNQITDTSDIQSHVRAFLNGRYLYLIPKSNSYLY